MTEKALTETEWTKISKARGLKDPKPFAKALAALEAAKAPDKELEALDEIEKQAAVLRKANKADDALVDYFKDLDKALDKQRKAADAEAKKAAKAAEASGDDDEESPALLTTKMIPLLREVRKGGGDVSLPALIAVAGKETVVLLSRRAISPARGKLLKEQMTNPSGLKFIKGECLFEKEAMTFVVQAPAAGLAKKLRAALLAQTELRFKVRVRGEDPADIDDDGEDAPPDDETPAAASTSAAPAASAPAPAPAAAAADDALKATYETRIAQLEPRAIQAVRDQRGDLPKLRAVAEFARSKGDAGQYKAALGALDSLAKLVDAAFGAQAAAPVASEAKPAAEAPAAADPRREGLDARAAALKERLKLAIAERNPRAKDIALKLSEASVASRKGEIDPAIALLDEADALLSNEPSATAASAGAATAATATTGATSADPEEAAWLAALDKLQPRYEAALRANTADASKLRTIFGYALEQSEDGQFVKAAAALARLEPLLQAAEASGAVGKAAPGLAGIVAYRSSLLGFRAAAAKVGAQIANLKAAIPGQLEDETQLADDLAKALEGFNDSLLDLVDKAINDAKNEASPVAAELAGELDAYIDRLATHDLVRHVDSNPFGVAMSVGATLGGALAEIRRTLPADA